MIDPYKVRNKPKVDTERQSTPKEKTPKHSESQRQPLVIKHDDIDSPAVDEGVQYQAQQLKSLSSDAENKD